MKVLIALYVIIVIKFLLFFLILSQPMILFSGGSDADFYDSYARGVDSLTSSIWPDLLRYLNEIGLYSRFSTSIFLMIIGVIVIPLLSGRLACVKAYPSKNRIMLTLALILSMYPTLYYYSIDIYRDVFMLFLYLLGVFLLRYMINAKSSLGKFLSAIAIFTCSYWMYLFRGYLGFSFIFSFCVFIFFDFRRILLIPSLLLLLCLLNVVYFFGFFDSIMSYRELFDSVEGGSSLGIRFDSVAMFIPDFILSLIYQLFGLHFPNLMAIFVFLFESIPFVFALFYLVVNRKYADPLVNFMVVFTTVYSVIWLLGNDNLGTAMRLRMYTYTSIIICAFIVFQYKKQSYYIKPV